MTLQDLIAAVEGAEAGSRGLDCRVAVAMGWFRVEPRHTHNRKGGWIAPEDFMGVARDGSPRLDSLHGTTIYRDPPRFTASIDENLATIERDFPGWRWSLAPTAASLVDEEGEFAPAMGCAKTAPLALCAALLRAIQSQALENRKDVS